MTFTIPRLYDFFPQQLGSGIFKLFSGNRLISSQLTILLSSYYYDFSMFMKSLALLLLPSLAAAQGYGPPPGPAQPSSAAASATSSALAVAPTAPPSTSTQINVRASFLACSDTYTDKSFFKIDVAFDKTFVFNPPNITAAVGTLVTFYFPKHVPLTFASNRIFTLCNSFGVNHSVTQSTFADPCTYLAANATSNSPAGFDSGLQSSATFTINITDTNREHFPSCSTFSILKTVIVR